MSEKNVPITEYDRGHNDGYLDGYSDGHGKGYDEGHSDGYAAAVEDMESNYNDSVEAEYMDRNDPTEFEPLYDDQEVDVEDPGADDTDYEETEDGN